MPNRIVHFEIQAEDAERAIKFYKDVFGWEFQKWEPASPDGGQGGGSEKPYWMVITAPMDTKEPGINGGLLLRPEDCPPPVDGQAVNAYVCTVQVDSYDQIHDKIVKAGGTVALPKAALPGMAWQGYYKDTEGSVFGIHQPDENAK